MKVAFITSRDRIAPVYDVASEALIVEIEKDSVKSRVPEKLPPEPGITRALFFSEYSVDTVICGAISRPVCEMTEAYNIRVIPFVSGAVEEILTAYIQGELEAGAFAMPGCGGPGQGRGNYFGRRKQMFSNRKNGGAGMGAGRGRGNRGRGGGGSRGGMSTGGFCACAQCGYREPHARGVPCTSRNCPQCGSVLMRE